MSTHFDSNTLVNESILSAQSEDLDKTIEVLEELKDDLQDDAVKECFDVTIMALKEKRVME